LLRQEQQKVKEVRQVHASKMQGMWKAALEICTWTLRVGYFLYITCLTSIYSSCYNRLFRKKKAEIELSSGDENEVMEIKPKLEEMEPCCSSSLKD
jgi:hypothetical protein